MRPIRSIIIYTGGAGGDFLKAICCQQLTPDFKFALTHRGMMNFRNHYFKDVSDQSVGTNQLPADLDLSKLDKIENSHFYLNGYQDLADRLFFIDYPDQYAPNIVEAYKKKRWFDDYNVLLEKHQHMFPNSFKKHINEESIIKMLSAMWVRQLKSLRANSALVSIQLSDMLDKTKLKSICQTIINCPLQNPALFDQTFDHWIQHNQQLVELFSN